VTKVIIAISLVVEVDNRVTGANRKGVPLNKTGFSIS
jgi:hypothetical protein